MTKPYYQDEWVTIYHGDCRDILPALPKVDLVLTDPPYGINLPTDYASRGRGVCKIDYLPVYDDDRPFDPSLILALNVNAVLWGANYYTDKLVPSSGWIVWDKRYGMGQVDQSDCEMAWTNCIKGIRLYNHRWNGYIRDSENGEHYHPTQKPVSLMRWSILQVDKWNQQSQFILDPFMGAGSVIRAAKDLNRHCIGIEIEEKYCEIAAKRCSQQVFDFTEKGKECYQSLIEHTPQLLVLD
tara:strand:- start:446 stop:1165 length:720 start_codon:yes stop_codon:yes gene_type:complete